MSIETDPALYKSDYERNDNDRYWTDPRVTNILMRKIHDRLLDLDGPVWEMACGRGDIVNVLMDHSLDVIASDIDIAEFDIGACPCRQADYQDALPEFQLFYPDVPDPKAIVTNSPFGSLAEKFLRYALSVESVEVVAFLLRSEFNSASSRSDLFDEHAKFPFAYELVLTKRPRWDWWFREKPKASPRHNYSWFVWDRNWVGPSTQYWMKNAK